MHFVCQGVGGIAYARARPAEIATRSMPKQEVCLEVFEMRLQRLTDIRRNYCRTLE